jgi:hypothetical protein
VITECWKCSKPVLAAENPMPGISSTVYLDPHQQWGYEPVGERYNGNLELTEVPYYQMHYC